MGIVDSETLIEIATPAEMKVKDNDSIGPYCSEVGMPPPRLVKSGILTLEETPVVPPLKLRSVKYNSPLGNVAKPEKKKKKKSFSDQCNDLLVPIEPIPNEPVRKNKSKSRTLNGATNSSEVIVIPDTPEPMKNRTRLLCKADSKNDSELIVNPSETSVKALKKKLKKERKKARLNINGDLTESGNNEPTHDAAKNQTCIRIPPDVCKNEGLESSIGTDDNSVPRKKKKRQKHILDEEVNIDANEPERDEHSPPKKKRKVLLVNDTDKSSKKKFLTVNIENDITEDASPDGNLEATSSSNITIDLEADSVDNVGSTPDVITVDDRKDTPVSRKRKSSRSKLNDTIVLSDEEDTDDIIVLGSPVVPSVKSYKEIGSKNMKEIKSKNVLGLNPGWQPWSALGQSSSSGNVIANAVSRLSQTVQGIQMFGRPITRFRGIQPRDKKKPTSNVQQPPPSPANAFGSNIYNPSGKSSQKSGLRPIIIDGSNIAMQHGFGRVFSCRGIEICVDFFEKKGHKVFAFVPQFRRCNNYTKDGHILERLHASNKVIFTPSRKVNGQQDVPYDDRYIVQTAAELGGVIVSCDNYRDLLAENSAWEDVIKNRLLMFTWVEDLLIFPQDPLGKRGKGLDLETFLRFPS